MKINLTYTPNTEWEKEYKRLTNDDWYDDNEMDSYGRLIKYAKIKGIVKVWEYDDDYIITEVKDVIAIANTGLMAKVTMTPTVGDLGENEIFKYDIEKDSWDIIPDYRGQIFYDTQTGKRVEIKKAGILPDNLTKIEPYSDFHDTYISDGDTWAISDKNKQNLIDFMFGDLLEKHRAELSDISMAINLGFANEADKKRAKELWQQIKNVENEKKKGLTAYNWDEYRDGMDLKDLKRNDKRK